MVCAFGMLADWWHAVLEVNLDVHAKDKRHFMLEAEKAQTLSLTLTLTPTRTLCDLKVILYVDLHGHSKKSNIFMYGVENPTDESLYMTERVIPTLLDRTSALFSLKDCSFDVSAHIPKTSYRVSSRAPTQTTFFDVD